MSAACAVSEVLPTSCLFASGPSTVLAYFRSSSRICVCSGRRADGLPVLVVSSGCLCARSLASAEEKCHPGDLTIAVNPRRGPYTSATQVRNGDSVELWPSATGLGRVRFASNTLPTPTNIATMRTRARRAKDPLSRSRPLLASAGNSRATHRGRPPPVPQYQHLPRQQRRLRHAPILAEGHRAPVAKPANPAPTWPDANMCASCDAATPKATTNVRSNSNSSGVATRWGSWGSRPDIRRSRCARPSLVWWLPGSLTQTF